MFMHTLSTLKKEALKFLFTKKCSFENFFPYICVCILKLCVCKFHYQHTHKIVPTIPEHVTEQKYYQKE